MGYALFSFFASLMKSFPKEVQKLKGAFSSLLHPLFASMISRHFESDILDSLDQCFSTWVPPNI
jgi:hypothetical protein